MNSLENKLTVAIEEDQREVKFRQKRIKTNEVLLAAIRSSRGAANAEKNNSDYGSKNDLLREAVKQIAKQRFTSDDLEAEIKRINPEIPITSRWLRTALWNFAKKRHELVTQVVEGNNRQPAEFEKLLSGTNGNSELKIALPRRNDVSIETITTPRPKSFLLAAREAIQQSPDRFSTKDIFDYCNEKWPGFAKKNTDFSNALWVLCKNDEIVKVAGSVGQNRSFYQIAKNSRVVRGV